MGGVAERNAVRVDYDVIGWTRHLSWFEHDERGCDKIRDVDIRRVLIRKPDPDRYVAQP